MQIDINAAHKAIVCDILKQHVPQYAVWAFGSRVTGKAKPYSDLDLAIITQQPLDLSTSAVLTEVFEASDLPYKVDIVDWAITSAAFRKIISSDKVILQNGNKNGNITQD